MQRAAGSLQRCGRLGRLSLKLNLRDSGRWSASMEPGVGDHSYYATIASHARCVHSVYGRIRHDQVQSQHKSEMMTSSEEDVQTVSQFARNDVVPKQRIGQNILAMDKRKFLVNTLFDLKDSKEAVYGTLDAWVAWEHNFPLVSLKKALLVLEKEEQWHRIVQVIKWMLSKGQGTTMGTYEQLIRALEKDNRAEEAHRIWVKKIGHDLHSVPWRVCDLMISIYYRNNMLERLVKLFKELEAYDRKPPYKSIVRKVVDAHEMLGLLEEKNRVFEKYSDLLNESSGECSKKSSKVSLKNSKKAGKTNRKSWRSLKPSDNGSMDSGSSDVEIEGTV